jgi:cytochrome c oxidase subunit I+III
MSGGDAPPQPLRLPSRLPRPDGELAALEQAWQPPRGWRWPSGVNNTQIGLFYVATALLFFVLAGVLGLLIRLQLAVPGNTFLSAQAYNQVFTMHGTVMMFLFAVPVVEAIAVYLLPGMLGSRDLPFPRLGAYAFWAYAFGGLAFFCTLFWGLAPDGGWFMYPPLTSLEQSPGLGADFWLLGIGFIEISAIAGAIELIVGILFTRAPGMTLQRMPVFAWAMLVVALMIVLAFPAVIAGTLLLELERALDWPFFLPDRGGDPLLWQHLFWFFGHPEVYIIFLPAAGLVSMLVPVLAGTPLVGRRAINAALAAVGVISLLLWAHHMFTAGLGRFATLLVSAASLAVAVPTSVQVFAWLATLRQGRLRRNAAGLFLLGFFFIFVLGGLTGVMLGVLPFDWQVHDTHFIVAHLHYVLIGGMVFPVFAALYHWTPLVNGHALSERWGRWVFGLMFVGFNVAFFPMHVAGLLGMPRRVYTYDEGLGWSGPNLLSTVGAFIFAAGVALFLADAVRTWCKARKPSANPWQSDSLEWLPSGDFGTRSIPQVRSAHPLWDQPGLSEEVAAGGHWLPGTLSGGRETLITSPQRALPRHVARLTGDSWLPLLAGLGTAGFFLLLTVKLNLLALACGLGAIVALWAWLWETDRAPALRTGEVADGVRLPLTAHGPASPSWWAMVVLIVVDLTIFLSLAFSHLHVSMQAEVCPPQGSALPPLGQGLAPAGWALAGMLLIEWARRMDLPACRRPHALLALVFIAGVACSLAGFGTGWAAHAEAGLRPAANAWSATLATLLAYQGFHAVILAVMAVYTLSRLGAGLLQHNARATLDNTALMAHGANLQLLAGTLFLMALPALMG